MKFEELANELLLEIFEFLDTIRLFRAFSGLNSRFNNLFTSIQYNHIDFRSLSKQEFNNFCEKYLPTMIDNVSSLYLSDDDETPELSKLFRSYHFNFNQFINLRSISLYSINDINIINEILSQCRNLPQLTQFKMIDCYSVQQSIRQRVFPFPPFREMDADRQKRAHLINNIWSLPKLIHCNLNYYFGNEIAVVSSSIMYLWIENITCDFHELSCLFKHTPHLRHLHISVKCIPETEELRISAPSLISLKVSFESSVSLMKNLFRQVSNLCYLTVETSSIYLNGYQWEQILVEHLPKVKMFRLKMDMKFSYSNDLEKQVDQLLDTFRTSYWLEEHKWFVRCDWQSYDTYRFGILYTIPYAFNQFLHLSQRHSKSTCPNNIEYWSFDRVQKLRYVNGKNSLLDNSVLFSFRFSYLKYLQMTFPFNVNFWSIIPSLYHLISLDATLRDHLAYRQLQALLDQAPHLYSLKLRILPDLKIKELFQITSKSIRRLELIEESTINDHCFNTAECSALSKSPLGRQCEVLVISIEKQANVLDLINSMTNLRILTYRCEDALSLTNDELVQWIKNNQSPFISSFTRYTNQVSTIQYWIR